MTPSPKKNGRAPQNLFFSFSPKMLLFLKK